MEIYYKKNLLCDLKSVSELEEFIKNEEFYKFFRKFSEKHRHSVKEKMDMTEKISYKKIKPWLRGVLKYPETIYNKKFLECMGWEDDEIIEFVSNRQKNNSKRFAELMKESPELFYDKMTTRIEYWIKKGYSVERAKEKLSQRQRTFSKEICIEKFGEEEGLKVFNQRQNKWIKSLSQRSDYSEIQTKKTKYKYEESQISDMIKKTFFSDKIKELILDNLNCGSVNEFIDNVVNELDIKKYEDFHPFINSKLLHYKFNTDKEVMKRLFYEKTSLSLNQQTYGNFVYHNGIRFKSTKEYEIAKFLENKNINYIYEQTYPNSNFKCDFYLPQKNIYIEYYGMLDGKTPNNLNEIQTLYKNKMIEKNIFCKKNKLFLIENVNFDNLMKMLNEIL